MDYINEAPPLGGGDFEKRFNGQSKTSSENTNCNTSLQGPDALGADELRMIRESWWHLAAMGNRMSAERGIILIEGGGKPRRDTGNSTLN